MSLCLPDKTRSPEKQKPRRRHWSCCWRSQVPDAARYHPTEDDDKNYPVYIQANCNLDDDSHLFTSLTGLSSVDEANIDVPRGNRRQRKDIMIEKVVSPRQTRSADERLPDLAPSRANKIAKNQHPHIGRSALSDTKRLPAAATHLRESRKQQVLRPIDHLKPANISSHKQQPEQHAPIIRDTQYASQNPAEMLEQRSTQWRLQADAQRNHTWETEVMYNNVSKEETAQEKVIQYPSTFRRPSQNGTQDSSGHVNKTTISSPTIQHWPTHNNGAGRNNLSRLTIGGSNGCYNIYL